MSVGNLPTSRSQEIRYGTCPSVILTMTWYTHARTRTHAHTHTHTHTYAPHTHVHTHSNASTVLWQYRPDNPFFFLPSFLPLSRPVQGFQQHWCVPAGAAAAAITVHGSLGESCTHWTRMRAAQGEGESQREVRTLKNTNRVNERGRQRWQSESSMISRCHGNKVIPRARVTEEL